MTSLKTSIKTITYLSDTGCLEIQGASLLMIRCHLNRLMGERRLKVADVVRDTGLPRSTVTALWRDNAIRIELPVLSILCHYFNCDVSELLEFTSDENYVELSRPGKVLNNFSPRVWFIRK